MPFFHVRVVVGVIDLGKLLQGDGAIVGKIQFVESNLHEVASFAVHVPPQGPQEFG